MSDIILALANPILTEKDVLRNSYIFLSVGQNVYVTFMQLLNRRHVSDEVDFYNRIRRKYFDEQITIRTVFDMETVNWKANSCLTSLYWILSKIDQQRWRPIIVQQLTC